jgi:hypothetical protein
MPEIVRILRTTRSLDHAIKGHIGRNATRQLCMFETLLQMIENPRHPMLETHSPGGVQRSVLSLLRLRLPDFFRLERDLKTRHECIVLTDAGTHDEVH